MKIQIDLTPNEFLELFELANIDILKIPNEDIDDVCVSNAIRILMTKYRCELNQNNLQYVCRKDAKLFN